MKLRHVLKKRSVRITAIVLAFVAVGALWYFGTGGQKLIVSPESTDVVNYNNYTGSNAEGGSTMDYKNGRFAWLSDGRWTSMLTVADEKGQHQKFLLRLSSFQLLDDRVIYIDYDNDWALTAFDLNTRKTAVLHKDVESFLVYEK